jgi:hypothetical protein
VTPTPIGARRARAIGILAQPAEALRLLIQHQHNSTDQPNQSTEPAEPDATHQDEPACRPEPEAASELDPALEPEPAAPPELGWESEPEVEPDDHQSLSKTAPPEFDAKGARPRVVLHFHLAEAALRTGHAIVRPEDGDPITLDQLMEFLRRSRCQVRIQPVLNPTAVTAVDSYEIPAQLRAAVRALQVADVFPFGNCLSQNMDLDHTERYVPTDYGGPLGQTRLGNLGPMARPGHRAVTHGGWQKHQPEPGYYIHVTIGYVYLVTNQGTLALGRTHFSNAVWQASVQKPDVIPA